GFPYWPVNYGSGALGVDNRTFLIATLASSLPGQLSLVAVGAFIGDPTILNGIVVAASWALVIVLTIFSVRRWKASRHDTEHHRPLLRSAHDRAARAARNGTVRNGATRVRLRTARPELLEVR